MVTPVKVAFVYTRAEPVRFVIDPLVLVTLVIVPLVGARFVEVTFVIVPLVPVRLVIEPLVEVTFVEVTLPATRPSTKALEALRLVVVTPPKKVTGTEVVAPRAVMVAKVSVEYIERQLVPSAKQTF